MILRRIFSQKEKNKAFNKHHQIIININKHKEINITIKLSISELVLVPNFSFNNYVFRTLFAQKRYFWSKTECFDVLDWTCPKIIFATQNGNSKHDHRIQ